MLVISYQSRELADRCTKLEMAQQWLGPTQAQALVDMIADLEACKNARELIDLRGTVAIDGNSIRVDFSPNYFALLRPVGENVPPIENGTRDWDKVRRLMLADIAEHDDGQR